MLELGGNGAMGREDNGGIRCPDYHRPAAGSIVKICSSLARELCAGREVE